MTSQTLSNTMTIRFGGMNVELSADGVAELLDDLKPESVLRKRLRDQAFRMLQEGEWSKRASFAIRHSLDT